MARISGVDIPNAKRVEIGLTYIYGIGRSRSNEILEKTGINPDTRCKDLTEEDIAEELHNEKAANDLLDEVEAAILERQHAAESFEPYRYLRERRYGEPAMMKWWNLGSIPYELILMEPQSVRSDAVM